MQKTMIPVNSEGHPIGTSGWRTFSIITTTAIIIPIQLRINPRPELILNGTTEKFRNIFESFQDVYFRCDRNGIVTMVSPSVEDLTGLEVKKVIGKNITRF